jgi:predicted Fe-S protein YdhL (DUF1289 family)
LVTVAGFLDACRRRVEERSQRNRAQKLERLAVARPLADRQRQLRRFGRNVSLLGHARKKAAEVAATIGRLLDEAEAAHVPDGGS